MNLKLSQARSGLGAIGIDKYAFFAGGYYNNNGIMMCSNVIDVYYCSGNNNNLNNRINKYPTVFSLVVPAMYLSGNSIPIYEDINEGTNENPKWNIHKLTGYYIIFSGGMDINHNPLNSITILKLDIINNIITNIFNTLPLEHSRYNLQSYSLNTINENIDNQYFICTNGYSYNNNLSDNIEIFKIIEFEQRSNLYYCFIDNLIYSGYLCYNLIIEIIDKQQIKHLIKKYLIFDNDFNQFTNTTTQNINKDSKVYTFIKNEKIIETPIYSDNDNNKVIEYNQINNTQLNETYQQNNFMYYCYTPIKNKSNQIINLNDPVKYNFSNYKYINIYTCEYICEYSINYIDKYNIEWTIYTKNDIYKRSRINDIDNYIKDNDTFKLIGVGIIEEIDTIRDELKSMNDKLEITTSMSGRLVITNKGTTKDKAVEIIMNRLNIGRENIMTIGDGENDINMIKMAEYGVSMLNAPDNVKKSARFITKYDNNHDGVGKVIEEILK